MLLSRINQRRSRFELRAAEVVADLDGKVVSKQHDLWNSSIFRIPYQKQCSLASILYFTE